MEKLNDPSYEESQKEDINDFVSKTIKKKIDIDWDEIKKGVLGTENIEKAETESNNQNKQEQQLEDSESENNDSLNDESFSRPSMSEIVDSKQINEAKKELEEMYTTFSGTVEKPKELIEKEENENEMFGRYSGTETKTEEKEEEDTPLFNAFGGQVNINDLPAQSQPEPVYNKWQADSIKVEDVEPEPEPVDSIKVEDSEKEKPIKPEPPKEIEKVIEVEENKKAETGQPQEIKTEEKSEKIETPLPKADQSIEDEETRRKRAKLKELTLNINLKKQEIEKIIPGLLDKFGLLKKDEQKNQLIEELKILEAEKAALEQELGITPENTSEDQPDAAIEKSWTERQKEKISNFIKSRKEQNETEYKNLSPQKKTLFTKFVSLAKNRKVQAAIIGTTLIGISVAVPPVGGAAWLTHGIVTGFLPAELGIPLKVAGGAVGGIILRKAIEMKNRKNGTNPVEQTTDQEVSNQETPIIVGREQGQETNIETEINQQKEKVRSANKLANEARSRLILAQNSIDLVEKENLLPKAQKDFEEAFSVFAKEMYILAEKTGKTPNEIIAEMFIKKEENTDIREVKREILSNSKKEGQDHENTQQATESEEDNADSEKKSEEDASLKTKISDKIKTAAFSTKEKVVDTAETALAKIKGGKEKFLTNQEKVDLIKSSEDFSQIYDAIKKISETEQGLPTISIISEIERIRNVIKDSNHSIEGKKFIADYFTGNVPQNNDSNNLLYKPETDIPEVYEINNQINLLLKKEIENDSQSKGEIKTEKEDKSKEVVNEKDLEEKTDEEISLKISEANNIDDLCQRMEDVGIAKEVALTIREMKNKIAKKEDIQPLLTKIPDEYGIKNKVAVLIANEKSPETTSKKDSFESFDDLTNLSEAEKADIQMIRIGYKEPRELASPLKETVISLMAKEAKKIKDSNNFLAFYDALKKVCDSTGEQNGFSTNKIMDSMRLYVSPDKKNGRAEMLEEIPEVYGIRAKFLELIQKENILVPKGVSNEPALKKNDINNNPEIVTKKPNPSVTEKIQGVIMKDIENEIENASTQEEFLEAVSKVKGLDIPNESELLTIIYNGIAGKDISSDLDGIPIEHGIREALERIIEAEKE